LAGCTLGQVCHIVQLSISQKKLLGYLNGMVVPYHRSLSRVKEQSAKSGLPCANTARRSKASPLATWDMMRPCLQQLLSASGQPMPLSNLKRLFRVQFHVELSETALGYAKLSECLQDPRVRDLCDVKLQGQGYTIVPAKKPVQRSLISLADSLCMGVEEGAQTAPQLAAAGLAMGSLLRERRGCMDLSMDVIHSEPASSSGAAEAEAPAFSPSAMCTSTRHAPIATPAGVLFPPTPSPTAAYARSLPRLLGRAQQQPRLLAGATKEVLHESVAMHAYDGLDACKRGFDPLTPSTLSTMGFAVQNTFLHAPLPPPTPLRADARLRASSLPRQGRGRQ